MRIRYAYKLENKKGDVKFVVWNWVKQEEQVLAKYASEGFTKVTFHDRVRTGYRMLEDGTLQPTGLCTPKEPAAPKATAKAAPTKSTNATA